MTPESNLIDPQPFDSMIYADASEYLIKSRLIPGESAYKRQGWNIPSMQG